MGHLTTSGEFATVNAMYFWHQCTKCKKWSAYLWETCKHCHEPNWFDPLEMNLIKPCLEPVSTEPVATGKPHLGTRSELGW